VKHFDEAKEMWATLVPKSGQAKTRQGELLRAVERLRDEWSSYGNAHWDEAFEHFVDYVRQHLTAEDSFTDQQKRQINDDLDVVADPESGETSEELFDRLADRVVEWADAHPEPIPHEHIPDLTR
jgi:hypothetical protein